MDYPLAPEGEVVYLASMARLTPMSLQIANVVGAVCIMGGNVYTVISPWDVYYSGRETYFTPAPWSFFIWWVTNADGIARHSANFPPRPLIHMLILGTCIYQFSARGKEIILDRIGWRLPLLDFLNAMYIYSWTTQEYRYGVYQLYCLLGPLLRIPQPWSSSFSLLP